MEDVVLPIAVIALLLLALLLGPFLTDGAERTESLRLALIALLVGGTMAFYQWRRHR